MMRHGAKPVDAARSAMDRVKKFYPDAQGAIFVVDKNGSHAGACNSWNFVYAVSSPATGNVPKLFSVNCQ